MKVPRRPNIFTYNWVQKKSKVGKWRNSEIQEKRYVHGGRGEGGRFMCLYNLGTSHDHCWINVFAKSFYFILDMTRQVIPGLISEVHASHTCLLCTVANQLLFRSSSG